MVSKGRHPKNPINEVLQRLDPERFAVVEIHKGHRWGAVQCLICGMSEAIWSTPKVPENNAKRIAQFSARHQH